MENFFLRCGAIVGPMVTAPFQHHAGLQGVEGFNADHEDRGLESCSGAPLYFGSASAMPRARGLEFR
jgi:hypothetical protein